MLLYDPTHSLKSSSISILVEMIVYVHFAIALFVLGCGGGDDPAPKKPRGDTAVQVSSAGTYSQQGNLTPDVEKIQKSRSETQNDSGSSELPTLPNPNPPTVISPPSAPVPLYPPRPPPRRPCPTVNAPELQRAADAIGTALQARRDWTSYAYAVATILTGPELERFDEAEPVDFWNRCQGPQLLALAAAENNCPEDGYDNACHGLMMLVGNMLMPNDPADIARFLNEQGITAFLQHNAVALATKLFSSPRFSLARGLYGPDGLSANAKGMVRGYAANWMNRFPEIFIAAPIRPELPRIVILHGIKRLTVRDQGLNPHALRGPELLINRGDPIGSFSNQIRPIANLRLGITRVLYVGEDSFGHGLIQEWFSVMGNAINGTGTVFNLRAESQVEQLDPRSGIPPIELKAVGVFFALCIIHNRPTRLNLSEGFFKLLAGVDVDVEDILEIDREFYNTLNLYKQANTEAAFNDIDPGSALSNSGTSEVLTFANKEHQIAQAVRNVIMNNNPDAFRAVAEGLHEMIPREVLSSIGSAQLKRLICGIRHIDAGELIAHIDFEGDWLPGRIDWMREIIRGFDQQRLSDLLRFVTGIYVLPTGGFASIDRLTFYAFERAIKPFPASHTCFTQLDMPQYDTLEETRTIFTNVVDTINFVSMSER